MDIEKELTLCFGNRLLLSIRSSNLPNTSSSVPMQGRCSNRLPIAEGKQESGFGTDAAIHLTVASLKRWLLRTSARICLW
jgi:hypothetical protein